MGSGGDGGTIVIVVPCFNEDPVLLHLRNTLRSVKQSLAEKYEVRLILVNDCSKDESWKKITEKAPS